MLLPLGTPHGGFAVLSPLIGVLLALWAHFSYFTERREYGMNATALKGWRLNGRDPAGAGIRSSASARSARTPYKRRFYRPRRRHDPMLVFNMSIFNSAKIRECIFDSFPQRENVWL
jgi:hypothetical protein